MASQDKDRPDPFLCMHCQAPAESGAEECVQCGEELLVGGRFKAVRHLGSGGSSHVYEVVDTEQEGRFVLKVLQFEDDKANFRTGKRRGKPLKLLHPIGNSFPSGFLSHVWRRAEADGMRFEVLDKRVLASRPDRGLVRTLSTVRNQHGEEVMTMIGLGFFPVRS